MASKLLIVFLILAQAYLAHAFSVNINGATSSSQDLETPSKLYINAGYALPTASSCAKDGINTCNTCLGNVVQNSGGTSSVPAPCNEKSIYEELPLTIQVTSDKTDINDLVVGVATSTTYSGNSKSFTLQKSSGNTYTFSAPWSLIASTFDLKLVCANADSASCGGTATFYFGPVREEKFVEQVTVVVTYGSINYNSASDPVNGFKKALAPACLPTTMDPLVTDNVDKSEGLCFFEMFPGDGKAYINNAINGWGSTPADPNTALTYSSLVMFYIEKTTGTSFETLKTIQNNSPKTTITIAASENDPLSDYKVGQLENGNEEGQRTYCFLPALQDQVGNIYYYLDIQKIISTGQFTDAQFDKMCASPSEVVGILSDKDCFIATVAFGTRFHPFLDILRQFRNTYLHPYAFGQKIIKFYYAKGPGWAKEISHYPLAKSIVKVVLLPVIAFAYLVLHPALLVGLMALIASVYFYRRRKGIA